MVVNIVSQEEAGKEVRAWKKLDRALKGADLRDILFLATENNSDLVVGFLKSVENSTVVLSHERPGSASKEGGSYSISVSKGNRRYWFSTTTRTFTKYRVNLPTEIEQAGWQRGRLKNVDYGDLLLLTDNVGSLVTKVAGFVNAIKENHVTLSYEHPFNCNPYTIQRNRDYELKDLGTYKVVKREEIMQGDILIEKEETKTEEKIERGKE
jgi:hypothetical protein